MIFSGSPKDVAKDLSLSKNSRKRSNSGIGNPTAKSFGRTPDCDERLCLLNGLNSPMSLSSCDS
jgi:hypothetical protein